VEEHHLLELIQQVGRTMTFRAGGNSCGESALSQMSS
jgi:hypothetical protein